MHTRVVTLAAFAASLYPFTLFWLAGPDRPRAWMLAIFGGGVALALACALVDGALAIGRWVTRLASALCVMWVLACVGIAGPTAAAGFLLAGAAALALGARMTVELRTITPLERAAIAYLAGMAVFVAVLSLVLGWRVHYPAAYALACMFVIASQRRPLAQLVQDVAGQVRGLYRNSLGGAASLALLAIGVWMCGAVGTLTPIAAFDDLAFHLRMPYELLVRREYGFDVVRQVWASSPWAADLAFAIPFMASGGNEGVKAWVAGSYHFAGAVLLAGLLLRRLPMRPALWFLMAYLSIPLVMALNHTMHTEAPSAALVLAVFSLWVSERRQPALSTLCVAALLLAMLGALKASNLVASLLLGLLWTPQLWAQVRAQPRSAYVLLLAFATVLTPYLTAWVRTGNPVLPLFNHIFKSPYFGTGEFANTYFAGMFDLRLYARLFLEGRRFVEATTDIAGGLGLFMMLPAALVLLVWRGDRERRAALAVALGYSLVLLSKQQYLRYLFPVMGLALYACSRVWEAAGEHQGPTPWPWQGWWLGVLVLAVAAGVTSMPQGIWQTTLQQLPHAFYPQGRAIYLERFAPERALNQRVNADWGVHSRVLYIGDPFGADLHGTPLYPGWLSPRLLADAEQVADVASAGAFMRRHGVTHVIPASPDKQLSPGYLHAARAAEVWAREHGKVIATSGYLSLVELDTDVIWSRDLWRAAPGSLRLEEGGALMGRANVAGGQLVRLELEGTCDHPDARAWVSVLWSERAGATSGGAMKVIGCLPDASSPSGKFSVAFQLPVPRRADAAEVRAGSLDARGLQLASIRLRGMGP
ncbi:MAG: hypothetical protein HY854_25550 [Burkholderiales bacterium]|nr:hypothetical protein [Burkholderiales bacterium]